MANVAQAGEMLMSPEDFLVYPLDDEQAELVRGELRVTPPAGGAHALIGGNLFLLLSAHVKAARIGRVFGDGATEPAAHRSSGS